ncbi:hypothetical protein GmHk_02G004961 [Glycine max]|nr:hypothetical protein GmHk_02G004961 [Glycine max]
MQMADKGRGGGRRTFNRGRRCGFGLGAPITTNPFTFSIHISTLESMIHVIVLTPNTLPTTQDQPNPTFVRESIPTTPVGDASPSAPDDSLTPEFQPIYGCSNIISNIIREKFDEPTASWLKVSIDLHDRWFVKFITKGSCILKSAMNKIRNGQDKGKWIIANVRAALDEHWGSIDFLNKSSIAKVKGEEYQHCRDEILQHSTEEGTSTQDSPNTATFVNDNEIYLNVVGGPNYKRNVYMLGTLSKRFSCSKSAPSTSIAPSIIIKPVKM